MALNPFLDDRPIPKLDIGLKIKIKTTSTDDFLHWNKFFSYLMKKPKTKLTFMTTSVLRNMPIATIKYEDFKDCLSGEDQLYFNTIQNLFDNTLPIDLKIFIIAMFQIPLKILMK